MQERSERRGRGRAFGSGEQRLDPRSLDGLPPGVVDRLLLRGGAGAGAERRGRGAIPRGPWE